MKQWIWQWLLAVALIGVPTTEANSGSVREMRVHVVDARGEPVVGLEPNAFKVTTPGVAEEPITLSRFQEVDFTGQRDVNPTAPDRAFPRPHRRRYIALVLDTGYMTKSTFNGFKRAARYYIEHLRRPQDLVKLVHIDNGMLALTDFTNNATTLLEALEKVRFRGSLFRDLKQVERRIIEAVVRHLENSTQSFYQNQVNFQVNNKEIMKKDYLYAFYSHMLRLEQDLRNRDGGRSIMLLSGGAFVEYDSQGAKTDSYMMRLGEILNNGSVTVYGLMHKRGPNPFSAMVNSSNFDLFKKPDMSEMTLSNTNAYPPAGNTVHNSNTVFENNRQPETGPRELTRRTGGMLTVTRTAELDRSLADLTARIDHYYRLGWFTGEREESSFAVALREDLRDRGFRIFYGSDFSGGTPYLKLSSGERLVEFESLLCCSRTFVNQLDAVFGFDVFLGEDRTYRISVYGSLPGEQASGATVEVGFALISADNRIIDLTRSELAFQEENLDHLLYDVLISEQAPAVVRFYLRNMETGAMSLTEQALNHEMVVKPGQPLSQVLLSTHERMRVLVLPRLHQGSARAELRRISDPLFLGDSHYQPHVRHRFVTPEEITFFFHQYDVSKSNDRYQTSLSVRDSEGRLIRVGTHLNRVYEYSRRTHRWFGSLDTRSLPAGAYDLLVELTDKESGDRYRRTTRFVITKGL